MSDVLLDIHGLTKRFPGNVALDDVSVRVKRGEIVALLGHNGSGKSTFVKILSGLYEADAGEVKRGAPQHPTDLHFIHQNLGLVGTLTVAENLSLVTKPRAGGVLPVRRTQEKAEVAKLLAEFGGYFDADYRIDQLSAAQQTIVAIARAFQGWTSSDNVLVLDEPTATLHGEEAQLLRDAVRAVAASGAGIIYITHRLDEVIELADRVVVLKNGAAVARKSRGEYTQRDLVDVITGGNIATQGAVVRSGTRGAVRLEVRGLTSPHLRGVDLEAHAGEVLGISGLIGSGMESVNATIFGAARIQNGTVSVDGAVLADPAPSASIRRGIGYVPADRRGLGSVATHSARENITLPRLSDLRRAWGSVDRRREKAEVHEWMSRVRVLPAGFDEQLFGLFSGGNQQKIMLAKWLRLGPSVLLLDEPTQGVDAGAQSEIYGLIREAAKSGAAVVVSSSDAKELATISDRVLVMRDGVVADEYNGERISEAVLVESAISEASWPA
ncbi:sugar ABC transporter ATP-binding protein [Microbacterium sp. NPDC058062]|uniref:sugar ABC transporter ATP-binding protein n=1 Tax=Microbacterium sp. NPDC058062 TaxID=3346320 RepID=UPI0036D8E5BA